MSEFHTAEYSIKRASSTATTKNYSTLKAAYIDAHKILWIVLVPRVTCFPTPYSPSGLQDRNLFSPYSPDMDSRRHEGQLRLVADLRVTIRVVTDDRVDA